MAVASSQRSFAKSTGTGGGVCVLHGIAARQARAMVTAELLFKVPTVETERASLVKDFECF